MKKILIISILSILVLTSCNKKSFQRIVKGDDYELKYTKAKEYYENEKYSKAMQLYEQLVPYERGKEHAEEVYFYFAMCNFKVKDYILAGYYFRDFTNSYKMSSYHEEALYLSAYCFYLDAPKWSLDQEPTNQALLEFQRFLTKYPESENIDTCNIYIDELRLKLQTKSYYNAELYYDLGYFKGASIALSNSLLDYSDTPFKEKILFYDFKSSYKYATKSVKSKQKERYLIAIDKYYNYIEEFPDGEHFQEIEKLHKTSIKEIDTRDEKTKIESGK